MKCICSCHQDDIRCEECCDYGASERQRYNSDIMKDQVSVDKPVYTDTSNGEQFVKLSPEEYKEYERLKHQVTELKKVHLNDCTFRGNLLDKINQLETENDRLKRLDENVKNFNEDELTMIRTMLNVYYNGLTTGQIRSRSYYIHKAYQKLIMKILESLDK